MIGSRIVDQYAGECAGPPGLSEMRVRPFPALTDRATDCRSFGPDARGPSGLEGKRRGNGDRSIYGPVPVSRGAPVSPLCGCAGYALPPWGFRPGYCMSPLRGCDSSAFLIEHDTIVELRAEMPCCI